SSDYGYIKFTSGSNSVEFPAVGYRDYSDGSLGNAGTWGYYWSSVVYSSSRAYNLYFSSSSVDPQDGWSKRYGLSVRCVR
ncbi:MAG: fibrobacter succinogenes major paralogous domain-containing protein, partial [Rikenellaceae bacterium]|nr:fibrobacter succinogenes major paralogous domain-containing protein [Rikenellaceae bacterium]